MEPITDEALADIEALAEKATKGRWVTTITGDGVHGNQDNDGGSLIAQSPCERSPLKSARREQWNNDATFIAASRNAIPSIISRLRAAEKERDALSDAVRKCVKIDSEELARVKAERDEAFGLLRGAMVRKLAEDIQQTKRRLVVSAEMCAEMRAELSRLRVEIEERDDLIEELERNAEIVSERFERDCWRIVRRLLEITQFDFIDGDGVTAEEAFEHLSEYIKHEDADNTRLRDENTRLKEAQLQPRVKPWMSACFGDEISSDMVERRHRFTEEALELLQASGGTRDEALQLVDYVFSREIGEQHQEVGGVMITLAALCLASGLDMHQAGEDELARIWTKVDAIRAKQAAKPKFSVLPVARAALEGK